MKTCPNCGAPMGDEVEYCGKCGAYMGSPGERPYPSQTPPPGYPPSPPPPGYPPYPTVRFAGFWIRLVATLIDGVLLGVATLPIWIWVALSNFWTTNSSGVVEFHWNAVRISLTFLAGVVYVLYNVLMLGRFGATLGKMAVRVKVVRTDLSPVGYGWALLRETIGKWISGLICDLGYIWAGFDPRKQAWHDHIAQTLVIYK